MRAGNCWSHSCWQRSLPPPCTSQGSSTQGWGSSVFAHLGDTGVGGTVWEMLLYLEQAKPTQPQPRRRSQALEPLSQVQAPAQVLTKGLSGMNHHALNTHSLQTVGGVSHQLLFCRRACYDIFPPQTQILTYPCCEPRNLCTMKGIWWGAAEVILPSKAHKPLNKIFWLPCNDVFARTLFIFLAPSAHHWWTNLRNLPPLNVSASCVSITAVNPACQGSPEPRLTTPTSLLEKSLPQPVSEWFMITNMEWVISVKYAEALRKCGTCSEVIVSQQQPRLPGEAYTCFGGAPFLMCWCLAAWILS